MTGTTSSCGETPSPSDLTIAVIGGGSREWVPKIAMDIALSGDLHGKVRLYDVDVRRAKRNDRFGNWLTCPTSDRHPIYREKPS